MMKGIRLELIKTLGSKRFAISIFMIALGMLLNFITDIQGILVLMCVWQLRLIKVFL